MPDDWKVHPEAQEVMKQFSQLFEFRAILIFHELLSPIITPFILYFALRKRSAEIIDFFRHFTVDVEGLGDVCSFAQLDLQRHGDVEWVPSRAYGVEPLPVCWPASPGRRSCCWCEVVV